MQGSTSGFRVSADSPVYRELLRKEYQIGIMLYHPNIESIYGFRNVDGIGPCIVMEYVDGLTLSEYIRVKGGVDRQEDEAIIRVLCDAISYMHALGIIHRDLKPANIMLSHSGRFIKLIDLGLSDGS